jgi:hypothetical protein
MLYAGLDLSRKRLDVHLLEESGATREVTAVSPDADALRTLRPGLLPLRGASLIVSSNKTFSAWTEIFGDPVAVAAMVDRLVHHAEVIVLRGESYRLKGRGKEVMAAAEGS